MTQGSLYYYFRNKDELLYFCQIESLDRLLAHAKAVEEPTSGADDRLARLIRNQILCMLDDVHGAAAHLEFQSLPPELLGSIIERQDEYERRESHRDGSPHHDKGR